MAKEDVATSDMIEVDRYSESEWNALLRGCRDATVYQSWGYGEARAGRGNLCHIVSRCDGRVTGAAQARILKLPLVRAGIAYIQAGPLWGLCEPRDDVDGFRQMVLALKEECSVRRGLLLRIQPAVYDVDPHASQIRAVFETAGFRSSCVGATLLLDLSPSLEDLRSGLDRRWRANLHKAESGPYQIVEGTNGCFYDRFVGVYREMVRRKQFHSDIDLAQYRLVQENLPDDLKPLIILCVREAEVLAGLILSKLGDTAIALLAATGNAGTRLHVAHLVWWHAVKWLKTHGFRRLDLGGIDPERTPGTYQFKHGLAAKYGVRAAWVGRYETSANRLSSCAVWLGESARGVRQRLVLSTLPRRSGVPRDSHGPVPNTERTGSDPVAQTQGDPPGRVRHKVSELSQGDMVVVRQAPEIWATLDARGDSDGLPFMPEMEQFCGRRFRVSRKMVRTCVEGHGMRRMRATVFLNGLRCDGQSHGACQRACAIFWKEAWLRRVDDSPDGTGDSRCQPQGSSPCEVQRSNGKYRCQSTELINATYYLSKWDVRQYWRDLRAGLTSPSGLLSAARLNAASILRMLMKGRRAIFLRGEQLQTPSVCLNLQPGEMVQVKTQAAIAETLNQHGKNRGLDFVPDMLRYCGGTYRVKCRVNRLISGMTGEMRTVENTVMLEQVTCAGCFSHWGSCPRGECHLWREIWLQRA